MLSAFIIDGGGKSPRKLGSPVTILKFYGSASIPLGAFVVTDAGKFDYIHLERLVLAGSPEHRRIGGMPTKPFDPADPANYPDPTK